MPRDTAQRVQRYFERHSETFDRIYEPGRGSLWRWLERWRHRSMFDRFRLALEACGEVRGKRVLDVGCGSGRYAVELARRGADVVGVDVAESMAALALKAAEAAGVASRCRFLVGDVMRLALEEPFDISLAIGLFDYTSDPAPILARMRQLTRGRLIASFPVRNHFLAGVRKLRLTWAGCPVYFYTRSGLEALLRWPGSSLILHNLGRDYLVIMDLPRKDSPHAS